MEEILQVIVCEGKRRIDGFGQAGWVTGLPAGGGYGLWPDVDVVLPKIRAWRGEIYKVVFFFLAIVRIDAEHDIARCF